MGEGSVAVAPPVFLLGVGPYTQLPQTDTDILAAFQESKMGQKSFTFL